MKNRILPPITAQKFRAAKERGQKRLNDICVAVSAAYDAERHVVWVELSSGLALVVRPSAVQGLEGASPQDLQSVELVPMGLGLHFPALDADLLIEGLLTGKTGTKAWMKARRQGANPHSGAV